MDKTDSQPKVWRSKYGGCGRSDSSREPYTVEFENFELVGTKNKTKKLFSCIAATAILSRKGLCYQDPIMGCPAWMAEKASRYLALSGTGTCTSQDVEATNLVSCRLHLHRGGGRAGEKGSRPSS